MMNLKKYLCAGLTVLALLPAQAAETLVPLPVVVAESEAFEIVGRLEQNGLVFHVDRAPTNAPVLAASLSVERDGKEVVAVFDAASGSYRIDDTTWLQPLRIVGEHALAFTLVAGNEADLLAGNLRVEAAAPTLASATGGLSPMTGGVLLLTLGLAGAVFGWRKLKRSRGGAA